jgi:hypothetical protein
MSSLVSLGGGEHRHVAGAAQDVETPGQQECVQQQADGSSAIMGGD